MKLTELKRGIRAVVAGFGVVESEKQLPAADDDLIRRFFELGILSGQELSVVHKTLSRRGARAILVSGSMIGLGYAEAEKIMVSEIGNANPQNHKE